MTSLLYSISSEDMLIPNTSFRAISKTHSNFNITDNFIEVKKSFGIPITYSYAIFSEEFSHPLIESKLITEMRNAPHKHVSIEYLVKKTFFDFNTIKKTVSKSRKITKSNLKSENNGDVYLLKTSFSKIYDFWRTFQNECYRKYTKV